MVKKKDTTVDQSSTTKPGSHMMKWLEGKLNLNERNKIKNYISDSDNFLDMNASSPDFLSKVIDMVLEHLRWRDTRWSYFSNRDEEPTWNRYLCMKKSIKKYL